MCHSCRICGWCLWLVARSCANGNEPFGLSTGGKFLDSLRLLKKAPSPWKCKENYMWRPKSEGRWRQQFEMSQEPTVCRGLSWRCQWCWHFPTSSKQVGGPLKPLTQRVNRKLFFLWIKQPKRKFNNSHLVPRLRMRGVIPPCTYFFMEWCLTLPRLELNRIMFKASVRTAL